MSKFKQLFFSFSITLLRLVLFHCLMQVLTNWQSYACDRAVKRQADDIKLSLFNERIGKGK